MMAGVMTDEDIQGIVDDYKEKSRFSGGSRGSRDAFEDRIKKQLEKRLGL